MDKLFTITVTIKDIVMRSKMSITNLFVASLHPSSLSDPVFVENRVVSTSSLVLLDCSFSQELSVVLSVPSIGCLAVWVGSSFATDEARRTSTSLKDAVYEPPPRSSSLLPIELGYVFLSATKELSSFIVLHPASEQ